jgi:SAM-dependent methyltransferase
VAEAIGRRTAYEATSREERFIVPLLRDAILASIAAHAVRGARALDAGCGEQPFRETLERAGLEYHSLDVAENSSNTVEFVGALDADLPAGIGTYGFVLCSEVLEHVANWDFAFRNLAALLVPGGRALVTTPFVYPLHEEPHDYRRPTPHALVASAKANGLRVVEERRLGDSWDVLGTVLAATWTLPADRRLGSRAFGVLARAAHRTLWRLLDSPSMRSRVSVRGPWFLSTLLVLEKP